MPASVGLSESDPSYNDAPASEGLSFRLNGANRGMPDFEPV